MSNYRPMTAHLLRSSRRKSHDTLSTAPPPVVPQVGVQIALSHDLVVQAEVAEGVLGTPMGKIRWSEDSQSWVQVNTHEAGMRVFFQNDVDSSHTVMIITSIIPKGTACYAKTSVAER